MKDQKTKTDVKKARKKSSHKQENGQLVAKTVVAT